MSEQVNKLSSTDLLKVTFFIILSVIGTFFFGALAIPTIVTFICYRLAKKHNNIGYIEASSKFYQIYYILAVLFLICTLINCIYTDSYSWKYYQDMYNWTVTECFFNNDALAIISLIVAVISVLYFIIVRSFFKVCKKNQYIFEKQTKNMKKDKTVDIMGRDNMASYSVADELLKWKKLNDDGVISNSEFDEMKKKLLQR